MMTIIPKISITALAFAIMGFAPQILAQQLDDFISLGLKIPDHDPKTAQANRDFKRDFPGIPKELYPSTIKVEANNAFTLFKEAFLDEPAPTLDVYLINLANIPEEDKDKLRKWDEANRQTFEEKIKRLPKVTSCTPDRNVSAFPPLLDFVEFMKYYLYASAIAPNLDQRLKSYFLLLDYADLCLKSMLASLFSFGSRADAFKLTSEHLSSGKITRDNAAEILSQYQNQKKVRQQAHDALVSEFWYAAYRTREVKPVMDNFNKKYREKFPTALHDLYNEDKALQWLAAWFKECIEQTTLKGVQEWRTCQDPASPILEKISSEDIATWERLHKSANGKSDILTAVWVEQILPKKGFTLLSDAIRELDEAVSTLKKKASYRHPEK